MRLDKRRYLTGIVAVEEVITLKTPMRFKMIKKMEKKLNYNVLVSN